VIHDDAATSVTAGWGEDSRLSPVVDRRYNYANREAIMRSRTWLCCVAVVTMLLATIPALAHHSFAAEYDSTKPVKVTGYVTRVDWQNPHVYFYIDVKNAESGRVENWAFEMGAPTAIARQGWTKSTIKVGDEVTVEGTRAKTGGFHANARSVYLGGRKLGAASSEGVTP
jgi:hypothetical protein